MLVVAGGTAGHIYPAIGVAERLRTEYGVTCAFLTADRKIDHDLVPEESYEVTRYRGGGLGRSPVQALRRLPRNLMASVEVYRMVRTRQPKVIVSFGGFYSVPAVLAARRAGAKVALVEENAVLGRANSIGARRSSVILCGFESTAGLPHGVNAIVSGVPLRSEVAAVLHNGARQVLRNELGMGADELLLTVMSGSLGASVINGAVPPILAALEELEVPCRVRHFVGSLNAGDEGPVPASLSVTYERIGFDPYLYRTIGASDLVLSRAGGGSIAEMNALGVPSVLVPIAGSPRDHQLLNARSQERLGASVVVEESAIDSIPSLLLRLLSNGDLRTAMAAAALGSSRSDAASTIAKVVSGLL